MAADTIAKRIYDQLKQDKFDVYFPGQHIGDCISAYVVIKPGISMQYLSYSSNISYFDILCYIPKNKFSSYEKYLSDVEKSLSNLFPILRCSNLRTEPYFDDSINGWMVSTQYENYRKIYSDYFNQQSKGGNE